jgi:CubicO group peptidase (beta-lactamase class C family)
MKFVVFFSLLIIPLSCAMVFPEYDWETDSPESQGVGADVLDEAMDYMDSYFGGSGTDRVIVVRNGYLIWNGSESDERQHIYSSTKTFTSTVLGLLVDEGRIDLDEYVKSYLPEMSEDYSDLKVWHLATMNSGYNSVSDPDGRCWQHCSCSYDLCEYDLIPGTPSASPGQRWQYNDDNLRKLAEVIVVQGEESLEDKFRDDIADKIGITNWDWKEESCEIDGIVFTEPTGYCRNGIHISAKDFARLGHLYLNNGSWDGEQLLSESYVQRATTN